MRGEGRVSWVREMLVGTRGLVCFFFALLCFVTYPSDISSRSCNIHHISENFSRADAIVEHGDEAEGIREDESVNGSAAFGSFCKKARSTAC